MYIILLTIILIPLLTSFFLLFVNNNNNNLIRTISMYSTSITFFISLGLLFLFNKSTILFQGLYEIKWLSFFNLNFIIGIDGISLFFILLTTFLFPICILSSYNYIKFNFKFFYINFLIMESILLLVFSCLDIVFFYVFFESVLIPMYLILGLFGSRERKILASYMFFIYTFVGSVLMLLAILFIYYYAGTSNYIVLLTYNFEPFIQKILWIAFFVSFAVKVPMVPFYIWLPEAHVEAPTPGSVILAGILLKLGTYGFLRFSLPLFTFANFYYTPFVYTLAVVGLIYSSLVAVRQTDLKRIVAYASIAHMNLIMIGLYTNKIYGLEGSLLQMFSHGLVSGALFLAVGILYERYHTRLIKYYSGLVQTMPIFAVIFLMFTLANIALPTTSSFVGEFLIFLGIFNTNTTIAVFAILSMMFGSIYSLWLYNRVCYGNIQVNFIGLYQDLNKREFVMFLLILVLVFIIGIYPTFILDYLNMSVSFLLNIVSC